MTDWRLVDHPEDERYDEVHIRCEERWKESELSGDEWRFSYVAEVKRKGEIITHIYAGKFEWLLMGLQWRLFIAPENGDINVEAFERTKDKCGQPGCAEVATVFYRRIKRYTNRGDALAEVLHTQEYRQFCNRHKHRGDCDMDDAEHNYVVIENPNAG